LLGSTIAVTKRRCSAVPTCGKVAPVDHIVDRVAQTFGLGSPRSAEPVAGGLSNEVWKLTTGRGSFAVKLMRTNSSNADFRGNVEAAYAVEAAAFARGVPCPEPVPASPGWCLAEVEGELARVHRWCDGHVPRAGEWSTGAGRLLARIHSAGATFEQALGDEPWDEDGWASLADHAAMPEALGERLRLAAPHLAALEATTAAPGRPTDHVLSHGDLDPKNTLVVGGRLMALDWDAAGPQPVSREAVAVALDWSTDVEGFRGVLAAYAGVTGRQVESEPWVFGGWVAALGGWLVHNATARIDTALGREQVASTCDRLLTLRSSLEQYRAALDRLDPRPGSGLSR